MKVVVVSRKLVKPHTPTPPHLKSHNISFFDQLTPPINIGILLFYPSKPHPITHLQQSLSTILVRFYPLVGRYIHHHRTVDCSDQGVEFIHAQAPTLRLSNIIYEIDAHNLSRNLLPLPSRRTHESAPVASIQATELACGGLTIGLSISHKIFDTHSVCTFIQAWAGNPVTPDFHAPSLFPCRDDAPEEDMVHDPDVVVRRFVFDKNAIAALRDVKAHSRPISRVRAVSAFISRALIRADTARYGRARPCVISQPVNMRGRTVPPLAQHSCGNLVLVSSTRCITETEVESAGIQELADLIGDATEKSVGECSRMFFPGTDRYEMVKESLAAFVAKVRGGETNMVWLSDFTKFGFYEADLGWGKPDWVCFAPLAGEKMTLLMGNKEGDGIEAWLHLKRHEMSLIDRDPEMMNFVV